MHKNLQKLVGKLQELEHGGKIFLQGDGSYLIKIMMDANVPLEHLGGIDFADYFADKFKNSDTPKEVVAKKFTFVYNVGDEDAIKKDYSAQLLKGIIKKVTNQNCWVIVVSDKSRSAIEREYGLTFKNALYLPQKEEPQII